MKTYTGKEIHDAAHNTIFNSRLEVELAESAEYVPAKVARKLLDAAKMVEAWAIGEGEPAHPLLSLAKLRNVILPQVSRAIAEAVEE